MLTISLFPGKVLMSLGGAGKVAALDWAKVLEKCTPPVRKGIMDLRARHEDLRRLILETKAAIPTINLDYYRSKLPAAEYAGLLSETENKLRSFAPTKVDLSAKLEELSSQREAKVREECGADCCIFVCPPLDAGSKRFPTKA